jgi:hypothetical protein
MHGRRPVSKGLRKAEKYQRPALGPGTHQRMDPTAAPLLWMAPALSGGGYASEALAFAQGLSAALPSRKSFGIRQFAEQIDHGFVDGLPPALLGVLTERCVQWSGSNPRRFPSVLKGRPAIIHVSCTVEPPTATRHAGVVVCHSPPDAWVPSKFPGWDALSPCPPPGARHTIGRTMYETDSVPAEWVTRCNKMDRVWVPTPFHLETFARAGVRADKLQVRRPARSGALPRPSAQDACRC